ncbi:MAG: SCO family protein [Leptothrix sp. (in: b-proteobacteria)]
MTCISLHRRPAAQKAALALLTLLALVASAGFWTLFSPPVQAKAADDEQVWGVNQFPNVELTDQDGRKLRFFDDLIAGKVVSINFIFTSCSASCGLETARIQEVQRLLGDRVGRDVFFYSITIDPLTDTPAALKAYAQRFHAAPSWRFLTGRPQDIELLRRRLGLYDDSDRLLDANDHSLSGMIGNQATGRWMRSSPFENPHITATQLGSWLHNYKLADSSTVNRYDHAPKVQPLGHGESLFRSRCSACHSLDGVELPGVAARVGPDLHDVARQRPRSWLARWLKEPDRMLAEHDPQATALYLRYNRIAMPNLKLNEVDITALLDFLDEAAARPVEPGRLARQ